MIPKKIKSFSLLEITIVIIIVGVVAGFAVPNFGRAFAKSDERIAKANLIAARSAVKMYMANSGGAIPVMGDAAAINTTLGLSIFDQKMDYDNGDFQE